MDSLKGRKVCGSHSLRMFKRMTRGKKILSNFTKDVGFPLTYSYFYIYAFDLKIKDFDEMINEGIPIEPLKTLNDLMFMAWSYKN